MLTPGPNRVRMVEALVFRRQSLPAPAVTQATVALCSARARPPKGTMKRGLVCQTQRWPGARPGSISHLDGLGQSGDGHRAYTFTPSLR